MLKIRAVAFVVLFPASNLTNTSSITDFVYSAFTGGVQWKALFIF
jgi:hypothetical protein